MVGKPDPTPTPSPGRPGPVLVPDPAPTSISQELLNAIQDEVAFAEIPFDDVNQIGNFGERPLNVASTRGDLDEIVALVEGGADVNARAELGNSVLHEVLSLGHIEAVKFSLNRGASRSTINDFVGTPLDVANSRGWKEIVHLLSDSKRG